MKKNRIRLTEGDLQKMIRESIEETLDEVNRSDDEANRVRDLRQSSKIARTGDPLANQRKTRKDHERAYDELSKQRFKVDPYLNRPYNEYQRELWNLKESDLHRIVKESVKKVLKENDNDFISMLNSTRGSYGEPATVKVYYKGKEVINDASEYDIRAIQVMVCKGQINPNDVKIVECNVEMPDGSIGDNVLDLRKDGCFANDFVSSFYDRSARMAFDVL